MPSRDAGRSPETREPLAHTISLLDRLKQGDDEAVNMLVERAVPRLRRWARGQLPRWARGLAETEELLHDAIVGTLPRLKTFEPHHPGALQAFLRRAVRNRICEEVRKASRRPLPEDLHDAHPAQGRSPEEQAIQAERQQRWKTALDSLSPLDRQAIVLRVDRQLSYEEVADALGKPSADAARMTVCRALKRLLQTMHEQ